MARSRIPPNTPPGAVDPADVPLSPDEERFGRLVLLGVGIRKGYSLFRCDCGVQKEMRTQNVKSGHSKSCGCGNTGPSPIPFEQLDITTHPESWLVCVGPGMQNQHALYRCACGTEREFHVWRVRMGTTKSCGCRKAKVAAEQGRRKRKHGMAGTRVYSAYKAMLRRCCNSESRQYRDYGGRGIKVCERWQGEHGFENFLADMGEPPPNKEIDRTDNELGYEPSNCRWVTPLENRRNTRKNVNFTYGGKMQCLSAWAVELGVPIATLSYRIRMWGVNKAMEVSRRVVAHAS